MGLRQAIEKNKTATTIAAIVILCASVATIGWQATSADGGETGTGYFSDDDGKTFFKGDIAKISPFDHNGKQANQAHVFECQGKRVVGYLTRYSADALRAIAVATEAKRAGKPVPNVQEMASISLNGIEYKMAGSGGWVTPKSDPTAVNKIRVFRCPDGVAPPEVYP